MKNLLLIKQQVDIIKSSINEIDMKHFNEVTPALNELLQQIGFATDDIEMTLKDTNYVGGFKEQGERNRPSNTPGT